MSRACTHKRAGIVTNLPPGQPLSSVGAHASQTVCNRTACVDNAISSVAARTNMTAKFYPDPMIRAMVAAARGAQS